MRHTIAGRLPGIRDGLVTDRLNWIDLLEVAQENRERASDKREAAEDRLRAVDRLHRQLAKRLDDFKKRTRELTRAVTQGKKMHMMQVQRASFMRGSRCDHVQF